MPPTSAFSIRAATPEDIPRVIELLAALARSQGSLEALCVDATVLLRDAFGDNPRCHVLVAQSAAGVVGVALYFFNYSTWISTNGLYLEDLYVDPGWRRRGIARALMRELAKIADATGCRRLQWLVLRSNEDAIRFYESLGAAGAHDWFLMQLRGEQIGRVADGLQ